MTSLAKYIKFEDMRKYKKWSREEVIKTIREFRRQGLPLNLGYVARRNYSLAYAARKYIGSWEEAIRMAGLDYEEIKRKNIWQPEAIKKKIRELAREKKPLNVSYAEHHYGGLVGAAVNFFGSWRKAIESAGFNYDKIKKQRNWSEEKVIKEIRKLHRQGVNLKTTREVRRIFRTLHAAAIRYFRSWRAAVAASGIKIKDKN